MLQVSCNNKINVNSNWQETIVIYGILEPGKDQQKIRVSKAFQNTNSSALKAAQISDSIFLDTVIVRLTDLSTGQKYILTPSFAEPKEPGIFANDKNPIYLLDKTIHGHVVKEYNDYEIEVLNPKTGSRTHAKTRTLEESRLISPIQSNTDVFLFGTQPTFSIKPGRGAYTYSGNFDFHYKEWNALNGDSTNQNIRWKFMNSLFVNPGGISSNVKMPRKNFFQLLSWNLIENKDLRRRTSHCDFIWTGGNKDFYDFISINRPSIGVVQKQTQYTNVVNGFGLFASRTIQTIKNCQIHSGFTYTLQNDYETQDLNFEY